MPQVREAAGIRNRRDAVGWRRGLQRLAGGLESALGQELHGGVVAIAAKGVEERCSTAVAQRDEVGNGDRLGGVRFEELLRFAHQRRGYGSSVVAHKLVAVVVGQCQKDIQQHFVKASP